MTASMILTLVLIMIVPGAAETSNLLGRLLDPPFWVPQLVCGVIAGWFVRRRFAVFNSGYALLIPFTLLISNILTEGRELRAYTPLRDVYFSANNGATEGLYELFFTAPVYTAIA